MNEIKEINKIIDILIELKNKKESIEMELITVSEEILLIENSILPELMRDCGLNNFTSIDGTKVKIKTELNTSVIGFDMRAIVGWLDSIDLGGIVKRKYFISEFDLNSEMKKEFEEKGVLLNQDYSIHPQVLKKALKDYYQESGVLPPSDIMKTSLFIHAVIEKE